MDRGAAETLRRRLADVCWFMGTQCEHLARRFNRESHQRGTFWEHRFGRRRLADEGAILLCGMYVDLNPIRAGEASTPEAARYTSAYQRIQVPARMTGSVRLRSEKTTRINSAPSRRQAIDGIPCWGTPV